MPKYRRDCRRVDKPFEWSPRGSTKNEQGAVIAAAGQKLAIRGELQSGDGASMTGKRNLEVVTILRHLHEGW